MSSWRAHSGRAFRASKYCGSPVGFLVEGTCLGSGVAVESAASLGVNGDSVSALPRGADRPFFGAVDRKPSREIILSPTLISPGPSPRLLFGIFVFRW